MAAAFCCAVLKARPLEYIMKESLAHIPINSYESGANELCAYLLGIQVLRLNWIYKTASHAKTSPQQKNIYHKFIESPFPNDPATSYADWFIKLVKEVPVKGGSVNYFDYEDPHFDERRLFFIPHMYFLIENYSYQFYRAEIAENERP